MLIHGSSSLQEVLKQLQSKLEQEAGTLASSGRSDVLHQLKGQSLFSVQGHAEHGLCAVSEALLGLIR